MTIDKLQGSTVNISTEHGLLEAKYLYTESSFLSSAAGDITLGSVHGKMTEAQYIFTTYNINFKR